MKAVAAVLLVIAATVFVVSVTVGHGHGGWGYLQAAAEAAMIGGLADWFAVTALFRRPLGLPIPHTAIIPRKKDQIGSALAGFVQQNFLTSAVVGERLRALDLPRRLGEWLAEPAHANRVADEVGAALTGASSLLRDDELRASVATAVDRRLHDVEVAALLARAIDTLRASGQHQVVLGTALRGLMRFLDENRSVFRDRLEHESPDWVPSWVDGKVFNRAFSAVQSFLADVSADDEHQLRVQFDQRLADYATALRTDPAVAARAERTKNELLDRPDVHEWVANLWTQVKNAVITSSNDPASDIHRAVASVSVRIGTALTDDPELRAKTTGWLDAAVTHLLARYASDIAALISGTIERWDAAETGRRIEIQVGRDLQWIRVNGTVVGALVGVVIYAISRVL